MRKPWKTAALLLVAAVTAILPVASGSGGTIFRQKEAVVAHADGGAYNKLAVDLATATAFDDARNMIKAASSDDIEKLEENFDANLTTLCGSRFGNVGLLIGPRGTSTSSDDWSILTSKISIDNAQIDAYDDKTGGAFSKYKAFGGAVQKLNSKAQKAKGSATSIQTGLDELSSAAAKLTNLGAELLSDYNPAPLVLSMFDVNELNTHPHNKIVALVNANRDLRELFTIMGSPTRFGVPMSFLLLFFAVFLLFITSTLMTLINGRSAGENIRKMMVKVLIGSVSIPLLAKGLDAGIGFLGSVSLTQANSPEASYVEQNLNFADWYACGFSLPSGTNIGINKNGEFVMTANDVRAINTFTYQKIWGSTPTDQKMMEKMEEYYNMYKANPMAVNFSEPTTQTGGRQGKPWRTRNFYEALDNFGTNELLTQDLEFDEDGSDPDLANIGYFAGNRLNMASGSGSNVWVVSGTGQRYGISPIAATNLMRTTFTGSAMTVNSNSTMGGVVFGADNGPSVVDNTKMPSLVRFLATFSMIMAAMKGLFSIFTAGFGGVLAGSAKSATGSTAGFGQAVGGAIALVGGVFGISVIMTMSFTLVDQLYGVMQSLLSGVSGGDSILEPFREAIADTILGPFLADIIKNMARFILSLLCMLTFPKFGGIPVTLYCQFLAELPGRLAERAQQIENRFTGDFRGGGGGYHGGGMSNANTMINQAAQAGVGSAKGVAQGASMALGAIGGLAASKVGNALSNRYKDADTGKDSSMTDPDEKKTDPENIGTDPETVNDPPTTVPEDGHEEVQSGAEETVGPEDGNGSGDGDGKGVDDGPVVPEAGGESSMAGMEPDTGEKENIQVSDNFNDGDSMFEEKDSEEAVDSENTSDTMDYDQEHTAFDQDSKEVTAEQSMANQEIASAEYAQNEQFGVESTMSEDSQHTEQAGADQVSMNEQVASEKSVSNNTNTGQVNAEHSMSAVEKSAVNNTSQVKNSATSQSMSNSHAENRSHASASVRSSSHTTPGGSKSSMSGGGSSKTSRPAGGRVPKPAAVRSTMNGAGTKSPGNGPGGPSKTPGSTVSNAGSGQPASRKELTQAQRHNRNMQAFAKGLQKLGNNTTGAQAAAGVAAGLVHAGGSAMGVGHVTGKGVQAVRNYKQRQNDIRDGLRPGYTRDQEARTQQAEEANNRAQQQRQDDYDNDRKQRAARRGTNPNARRQEQLYAEDLAREVEEARRSKDDHR